MDDPGSKTAARSRAAKAAPHSPGVHRPNLPSPAALLQSRSLYLRPPLPRLRCHADAVQPQNHLAAHAVRRRPRRDAGSRAGKPPLPSPPFLPLEPSVTFRDARPLPLPPPGLSLRASRLLLQTPRAASPLRRWSRTEGAEHSPRPGAAPLTSFSSPAAVASFSDCAPALTR